MVRAAVRGVIDYHEANVLDPAWWRRHRILLNGLAYEDDMRTQDAMLRFHLALVGNSGLTEESFKTAQSNAKDTLYDYLNLLKPWEILSSSAQKQAEVSRLKQAYIRAYGDPSDPQWQAEQEEALREWKEARIARLAASEDNVMTRLAERRQAHLQEMRERQNKIKNRRQQGR